VTDYLLLVLIVLQLGLAVLLWRSRSQSGEKAELMASWRQEMGTSLERLGRELREELVANRREASELAFREREERSQAQSHLGQTLGQHLSQLGGLQGERLESFARELTRFSQGLDERFVQLRAAVENRLQALQVENSGKLDEMRRTVDEKLHATLEQRLGESFKLVSERLEQVHRGLGEMQHLAAGVGDLKRVLTNVKTRGSWGEVQLANLLEQWLRSE